MAREKGTQTAWTTQVMETPLPEEALRTYRLIGTITLLEPLSHIGKRIGPDSFLSDMSIVGPDGQPARCFAYSGNAFRGQLRDLAATYLLDRLGLALPLETFYLLFSGGSIGGESYIDIDDARRLRQALPHLALFGGAAGNQMLEGSMDIGSMWPLCAETQRLLPLALRDAAALPFSRLTADQEYSRSDDAKKEGLRRYLASPNPGRPALAASERPAIEGVGADGPDRPAGPVAGGKGGKGDKGGKDRPAQMRYAVEYLLPGVRLYQRIDLKRVTELQLGAFVAALSEFSKVPRVGGMARMGYGLVEAEWRYIIPGETVEPQPFAMVEADAVFLAGPRAQKAQEAYDEYLRQACAKRAYDEYLQGHAPDIKLALGVGGGIDAPA